MASNLLVGTFSTTRYVLILKSITGPYLNTNHCIICVQHTPLQDRSMSALVATIVSHELIFYTIVGSRLIIINQIIIIVYSPTRL